MKFIQHTSLEPGFSLQPGLIDPLNYANDPAVVDRVLERVLPFKNQVEIQRAGLEKDWLDYYRIWAMERGGKETLPFEGMNEVYLPDAYLLTETEVDHLKNEIFPFSNNIAIRPWWTNPVAPMLVLPIMELIQYDINQADVRSSIDCVLRDAILYGWKGVKVVWEVQSFTDYARGYAADPMSGAPGQPAFGSREVVKFEGPTFHPVNNFSLYVHPMREWNPKRLTWIHENMTVPWDFLLSMQREGVYAGVERLLEKRDDETGIRSRQNIDAQTARIGVSTKQFEDPDAFDITEVWTKFDLYGRGEMVPCKITYSGRNVLEVRQNPYNDQEAPYVFHRDGKVTESFYGRSRIKSVKALQYTANAVWNQGLDSNAFASANMIVVDKSRLHGRVEDLEITPLMIFQMNGDASEKAIRFVAPPNTVVANVQLGKELSTQMRDAFRIPTAVQGKTSEGATATEVATTTQAGLIGIGGVATNFEEDMMSRWCTKAHRREQQFRGINTELRAGMPQVPAEALVPDYMWQFLAGKQAQLYMQEVQAQMQQAQAGMEGAPSGGDHPNGSPKPPNNTPDPSSGRSEIQ